MRFPDRNIVYETAAIEAYYSEQRIRWAQFYESERLVFEQLALGATTSVLDVGCGCGGLGLALRERFGVAAYTGVDINRQVIATARRLYPQGRFLHGDILEIAAHELAYASFDAVISLSCIDWNVQFTQMLTRSYCYVKPGGSLVSTFRLTDLESVTDPEHSYQYINFAGRREGEVAPYVVLNFADFMRQVSALGPTRISGVGYWGPPSSTAVTPVTKIVFAAVALQKPFAAGSQPAIHLDLPADLMDQPGDAATSRRL